MEIIPEKTIIFMITTFLIVVVSSFVAFWIGKHIKIDETEHLNHCPQCKSSDITNLGVKVNYINDDFELKSFMPYFKYFCNMCGEEFYK